MLTLLWTVVILAAIGAGGYAGIFLAMYRMLARIDAKLEHGNEAAVIRHQATTALEKAHDEIRVAMGGAGRAKLTPEQVQGIRHLWHERYQARLKEREAKQA